MIWPPSSMMVPHLAADQVAHDLAGAAVDPLNIGRFIAVDVPTRRGKD
jgi:hypothetical protein